MGHAELVFVEAGRLALAFDNGMAWIRNASQGTTGAEDAANLGTGTEASLDAAAGPLVLLAVAITEVAAAATPTRQP
ncbi:MAG: hypothetical protein QOF33_541 [Thermomicrobiales bacterium]|jgi:hypothetical protein|nr:hypothetical protein [Thermomicrobiales bacterium]MEA2582456.1 hypothetical protein [Thermomicrobiales bacterium]